MEAIRFMSVYSIMRHTSVASTITVARESAENGKIKCNTVKA